MRVSKKRLRDAPGALDLLYGGQFDSRRITGANNKINDGWNLFSMLGFQSPWIVNASSLSQT